MTDLQNQDKDVSLAPHERLDTVNQEIRLIQNKNGLTFGTDAYLLAALCAPPRVPARWILAAARESFPSFF